MADLSDESGPGMSGSDTEGAEEAAMREALEALLDFDVAAGVDLALDEEAHDRFADEAARRGREGAAREAAAVRERRPHPAAFSTASPTATPPPSAPHSARAPLPPGALDPEEAAAAARARAEAARDVAALRAAMESFEGCALKAYAKSFLFFEGRADAKVVFMGYAPTADEDRTGRLLDGREGVLFDNILAALELSREDVMFARAVPWRPAGARVPTQADLGVCRPFAVGLLRLVRPHAVVCLGSPLAQMLFEEQGNVKKLQGRWQTLPELGPQTRILPTFDLERLLKMPTLKALAWRDLRALRKALDQGR